VFAAEQVTFVPQFLDGTRHEPRCDDAYVRVRLSQPASSAGAVNVYLPDGTALVVPAGDLVRLAPADIQAR
jgi:hypothetical protein